MGLNGSFSAASLPWPLNKPVTVLAELPEKKVIDINCKHTHAHPQAKRLLIRDIFGMCRLSNSQLAWAGIDTIKITDHEQQQTQINAITFCSLFPLAIIFLIFSIFPTKYIGIKRNNIF